MDKINRMYPNLGLFIKINLTIVLADVLMAVCMRHTITPERISIYSCLGIT